MTAEASSNDASAAPHDEARPGRVFIVDDHVELREMLVLYMEMENDLVVCGTAGSGDEALATFPADRCDVVLVDVSMPGMSGIELVQHLRDRHPDAKCLVLSGHAEQVYVEGALEAGAQGYVMKGDPEAILAAVRHVLGGGVFLSDEVRRFWRA